MSLRDAIAICPTLNIFANDTHSLDPWAKHKEASNAILDSITSTLLELGVEKFVIDHAAKDEFYIDVTFEATKNDRLDEWVREAQKQTGA